MASILQYIVLSRYMRKNLVLKEPFSQKEHELFAKLSALAYEPPLGFLLGTNFLSLPPATFNQQIDKELSILNNLIQKEIKNGLYCGTLQDTNKALTGFFISNRHDLNCYIIRVKKTDPKIYVIFRGTSSAKQWKSNLSVLYERGEIQHLLKHFTKESESRDLMIKLLSLKKGFYIYPGFAETLFASLDIIHYCVHHLLATYPKKSEIYTTGHSLGGALATLYGFTVAYSLSEKHGTFHTLRKKVQLPINVCSLGSPKVGNEDFSLIYNALIETRLIRLDRAISVTKYMVDPITRQPANLIKWATGIRGHPGFSQEKKLSCQEIYQKLEEDVLAQTLMVTSDLPNMIQEHCAQEKKIKLTHPQGAEVVVEATKDETKGCPGFALADPHGFHGYGMCHAWYFGISFMHLAGYPILRMRALASNIYTLGEFSSLLCLLRKGVTVTKIVGDKIDKQQEKEIYTPNLLCQRDQAKLVLYTLEDLK